MSQSWCLYSGVGEVGGVVVVDGFVAVALPPGEAV